MPICKVCKSNKQKRSFYESNKSTCKECVKAAVRENRKKNIEHYRQYDKDRANNPDRVEAREAYSKTDAGKKCHAKAVKKSRAKFPNKYKARNMVNNAIRDHKLFKEPCEECGAHETHGHHDDYAKPLNVRWLCPACHSKWHKKHGEGLNP